MKTLIYWTLKDRGARSMSPRFRLVVDPDALVNQGDPGFSHGKRTPPGVEVESADGNGDPCWVHARDARPVDEILRRAIVQIAREPLTCRCDGEPKRLIIDLGALP